jgi:hypothetical protein
MVKQVLKIALISFLLISCLFILSCDNTSGPRFKGEVYTVTGLLMVDQPISLSYPIYITRSNSLDEFDPLQLFVWDAEVIIKDLDTQESFSLTPSLHEYKIKYIDLAEHTIQPEHRYRLEVQIPDMDSLIWAETTVPQRVELKPDPYGVHLPGTGYSFDPDTENIIPFNQIDTDYPLVVSTGNTMGIFNLWIETYCMEEFSTNLEYTNQLLQEIHPTANIEELYNQGSLGIRRLEIANRFQSAPLEGLPGYYVILNDYSTAFIFYGKYRVRVWVIDDNYYRFHYMMDGYLYGGVHNALGFFGSASGGELYARITKSY